MGSGVNSVIKDHNHGAKITRVELPSGEPKVISSSCRGMLGRVAGSGRCKKPILEEVPLLVALVHLGRRLVSLPLVVQDVSEPKAKVQNNVYLNILKPKESITIII